MKIVIRSLSCALPLMVDRIMNKINKKIKVNSQKWENFQKKNSWLDNELNNRIMFAENEFNTIVSIRNEEMQEKHAEMHANANAGSCFCFD